MGMASVQSQIHHGKIIAARRKAIGWSREKLADEAGVSEQAVGKAERAKELRYETLAKYAAPLGITPQWILGGGDVAMDDSGAWRVLIGAASAIGDDGTVAGLIGAIQSMTPFMRAEFLRWFSGAHQPSGSTTLSLLPSTQSSPDIPRSK